MRDYLRNMRAFILLQSGHFFLNSTFQQACLNCNKQLFYEKRHESISSLHGLICLIRVRFLVR